MIIFTWEHDGKQLLGVWWCPQLQMKKSYIICEIENSQIVGSFSQKVKPPSPKHKQSVTPKTNNWCKIFTMICKSKLVHNKTVPLCSPQKEDWLVFVWRLCILKFYKNWQIYTPNEKWKWAKHTKAHRIYSPKFTKAHTTNYSLPMSW